MCGICKQLQKAIIVDFASNSVRDHIKDIEKRNIELVFASDLTRVGGQQEFFHNITVVEWIRVWIYQWIYLQPRCGL